MGFLGKYAAARWMSQGSGGGGGGMGPLGLILLAVMGFFLIMLAIQAAFSFIYTVIRSILMIAPNVLSVLIGAALAFFGAALITPYSPEEASEYLSNTMFVAKSVLALGGFAALASALGLNLLAEPGEEGSSLIVAFAFLGILGYCLYYHYRSIKLVGAADAGELYQLAALFPLTTVFVYSIFSVPIYDPLGTILSAAFFAVCPVTIIAIHYRLRPHVKTTASADQEAT